MSKTAFSLWIEKELNAILLNAIFNTQLMHSKKPSYKQALNAVNTMI